jgi:hypothetical protein
LAGEKFCEGHKTEWKFSVSGTGAYMDQRYKSKRKIFVDPQIKEVMNDRNSDEVLDGTKETAWEAFLTLEADAKRLSTGSWL